MRVQARVLPRPFPRFRGVLMAYTKSAVRKRVTQAEWALLEVRFPPLLKDITPVR